MRHKLKNYQLYLQRIELYAQVLDVGIEYRVHPQDGAFVPTRRKVVIDPDLSETDTLATLLHELGHFLDDTILRDNPSMGKLSEAYYAVYGDKYTNSQLEIVVKCEERAWDYGEVIAKQLKIKLGKWYTDNKKDAIRSYRTTKKT
jgi:hypothetical protein